MIRRGLVAVATIVVLAIVLTARITDVHRGPSTIVRTPAAHVVILGDSVARGLGAHLPAVINLGINGARTYTVLGRLPTMRATLRNADAIVISIGGNDLFGNTPARAMSMLVPGLAMRIAAGRVERLISAIRRENTTARIYLLGLYNPYRASRTGAWLDEQVARWDARLIDTFASTPAVTIVRITDLFESPERFSATDHFHPSTSGYAAITTRLALPLMQADSR